MNNGIEQAVLSSTGGLQFPTLGGLGYQLCKVSPEANVLRGVGTPPLYNYETKQVLRQP